MNVRCRAGVSKCGVRFETLLRGPTQWCVEILLRVDHGVMIEIGDVTKVRDERATPRPLQRRLQWTALLNPSNNYNPHLYFLSGQVQGGCSTCRAERY